MWKYTGGNVFYKTLIQSAMIAHSTNVCDVLTGNFSLLIRIVCFAAYSWCVIFLLYRIKCNESVDVFIFRNWRAVEIWCVCVCIRRDLERGSKRENQKKWINDQFIPLCVFFLFSFSSCLLYDTDFFFDSQPILRLFLPSSLLYFLSFKQFSNNTTRTNGISRKWRKTHTLPIWMLSLYFVSTVFSSVRRCRSITNTPNRSLNLCIMFSFV